MSLERPFIIQDTKPGTIMDLMPRFSEYLVSTLHTLTYTFLWEKLSNSLLKLVVLIPFTIYLDNDLKRTLPKLSFQSGPGCVNSCKFYYV